MTWYMEDETNKKHCSRVGCKQSLFLDCFPSGLSLVAEHRVSVQVSIDSSIHPPTFLFNADKMDAILTALLIAVASYRPCQQGQSLPPTGGSQSPYHDCHFLLTCDQLELLWTRQFTKELWVHGPPGAGKTVAAMELVRELVERGCSPSQVLYLAENPLLCAYVR